jgi:predicted alpha/beta hydrolase family esterase
MKTQILFIQGGGEGAYREDALLAASLAKELGADCEVRYPEMPNEASPDYSAWRGRLAQELATMEGEVILVGHSLGASVLVKFLAEDHSGRAIAGIVLIAAPFIGEGGWEGDDLQLPASIGDRLPKNVPLHLYHGRDDETVPFTHLGLYARELPNAVVHRLEGRNHQLNNDLSEVARDIQPLVARKASQA